jgi:hypothetical protein
VGFTHLPQRVIDRMSELDRQQYALHVGNSNAGFTTYELEQKVNARAERELQKHVRQYLSQKEVVFICPPMFKRSELPPGWPDFTFAFCGVPIIWECKSSAGKLRESQKQVVAQLGDNGWRFRIIRSLEQARNHLREIDLERLGQEKRASQ